MKGEAFEDYLWVIRAFIPLLDRFKIIYLITAISDCDKALAPASFRVFEEKNHRINHILCVWHINQNVTANCKKHLPTMEQWEAFYKCWKTVVYSDTVSGLEHNYNSLHNDYSEAYGAITEYLEEQLWSTRRKCAKC